MRRRIHRLKWQEVVPRALGDFLAVQGAFLASLALVVWKQGGGAATAASVEALGRLYLHGFLPLSLTFPLIFGLCGFYTRSRLYSWRHRWRVLLSGAAVASLIYLLSQFLVNRAESLPRTAVAAFPLLLSAGVLGSRGLKHVLLRQDLQAAVAGGAPAHPPKVLVVGGAGYIGSVLCRRLLDGGWRVRVLDSLIYGDESIRELRADPRFELRVGDCRNIQAVVGAVKGAEAIVHLAAIVGDPACEQDRRSALEINYAATRMLIEVAKGYGVERFLFASSCSVYGASEEILDERSRLAPCSLYAETKVESERALLEARNERFHPVILRFATAFGCSPRPRFDLVVNLLTARAHRDGRITVYNGEQWRPFIHVEDVADGVLCALRAPLEAASGEIFNLGDNRLNRTLRELAEIVRRHFPEAEIEWVANADRRNYRVSFDKVRRLLGFEASWTLEAGIRQMKRALQEQESLDHGSPIYHNQLHLEQLGAIRKEELDARVMAAFSETLLREGRVTVET
jgi:nucleoside-diphosphate-sugar epimerase